MVTGNDQLLMIDAALQAGVSRFVPAEFGGLSEKRPAALDKGQRLARNRLRHHVEEGMNYTMISCGIFYERFAPNGLAGFGTGFASGNNNEGDYLMNVRSMRSQIPHDSSQRPAMICISAMDDVARFIVAALDLPQWPNELRMCGQRLNVSELVRIGERCRGSKPGTKSLKSTHRALDYQFERAEHTNTSLQSELSFAQSSPDPGAVLRVHNLIATGSGCFDFVDTNFNRMVNLPTTPFSDWLAAAWAPENL